MKITFIFVLFFTSFVWAAPLTWKDSDSDLKFLSEKMEFLNRSSCAKKSLEPTTSVFAIVDNVNIAKSLFRLARITGSDTTLVTNQGIEKFRYTLTSMVRLIGDKLVSGKLPLVSRDEAFTDMLGQCREGNCALLDRALANAWSTSQGGTPSVSCKVIKKFSTFHSNLRMSKPDRVLMSEFAKEMKSPESFVTDCSDLSDLSQPEVALYQFDVNSPVKTFSKTGFDFWASLKIYLSWAMRNSPEAAAMAAPFDYLFKSVNVEEMLVFFSNGCRSIKPPACSEGDLSLQNLRAFTRAKEGTDWSSLPVNGNGSGTSSQDLFSRPLPLLEEDLLNLSSAKSANDWAENFRDNFIKSRGYNKVRLLRASADLKLITHNLTPAQVLSRIQKDSQTFEEGEKQELYSLCAEYAVAMDENLGTLRKTIEGLSGIRALSAVTSEINSLDLNTVWPYFLTLSTEINRHCGSLKQSEIWDDSFKHDKTAMAPWYQTLLEGKTYQYGESLSLKAAPQAKPFLTLESSNSTVCSSGANCARILLSSVMTLSAISRSLEVISPDAGGISTNMANPYADKFSCGMYDPWAKRNQLIFNFFQDMVTAAVMGVAPSPIYVAATLEPKQVISFERLVKDGKVFYDPKFDKARLKFSVIGDLGTLTGIPCAVSISGTKLNPYEYYTFNGISVSSCIGRTTTNTVAGSGGETNSSTSYRQACFTCALNLQSAANAASLVAPPLRAGFFVIKGLVRLVKEMSDPHDMAKSWSLDPQMVALAYRRDGEITKSCASKLLRGESCFEACEEDALRALTGKYFASPVSTDFNCERERGVVKVRECADPIKVRIRESGDVKFETACKLKERTL